MTTSPTPNVIDKKDFKLKKDIVSKIESLATKFPEKNSALLPSLHLIQDEFGWIPAETVKQLAKILDTTPNKIYGILTFYTMFNTQPVGKYHVQVCRNVSCSLLGAKNIIELLTEKLKIKPGETTKDNKITLSLVECLGSCGTAPVMMINDKYYENLDEKKVDNILKSLK
jgi:NADH-quinone oxidoreductase subunit E